MKYSNIEKYEFLYTFLKKNYIEYLFENNITMIHFNINTNSTFLVYKDEIFVFEGNRSINKAYTFYNIDKNVCLEGIDYYKITKNYLDFTKEDDVNIEKGFPFEIDGTHYLVNYFNKGFLSKVNYSPYQLDQRMFYLLEFCDACIQHLEIQTSDTERVAVINLKNGCDYIIDMYPIEVYDYKLISKKYKKNKELIEVLNNKEYSNLNAKLGIFFIDGYKDCMTLEENGIGGFLYYALEDYNMIISPFKTISLEEIFSIVTSLLDEIELPITITTDNEFIYDIFQKSFLNKIDFILDKSDVHNRFIRELSTLLTLKNYDMFGLQSFCLIVENNYNEVSSSIDHMEITEYESILNDCLEMYSNPNVEDDMFDEFEIEEDEEIEEDFKVDTKLLS